MAVASTPNAKLEIEIKYLDEAAKKEEARIFAHLQTEAIRHENQLKAISNRGQKTREEDAKRFTQRVEQSEKLHQQRLDQMGERFWRNYALRQEAAQKRLLAGHTTWSQKIVANTRTMVTGVQGLLALQAVAIVNNAVKHTLSLVDQADALRITVGQMEALQIASGKAGVPVQRLTQLMVNLTNATSSPTAGQSSIIEKLGLSQEGLTNVQLFDAAILGLQNHTLTLADATELVGNRQAFALAAVANNMDELLSTTTRNGEGLRALEKTQDDLSAAYDRGAKFLTQIVGWNVRAAEGYIEAGKNLLWWRNIVNLFSDDAPRFVSVVSDMGDSVSNTTDEFLRLTQQDVFGPYIDDVTRKSLEAAAAQRVFSESVIADWEALVIRDRELEQAGRILERYLKLQVATNIAMSDRKLSVGRLPIATRGESTQFDPTASDRAIIDVNNLVESNAAAREYNQTLRELLASGQLTQAQFAAVNQLLGEQPSKFQAALQSASDYAQRIVSISTAFADLNAVQHQNQIMRLQREMDMEEERWNERADRMRQAGTDDSVYFRRQETEFRNAQKRREASIKAAQARAFDQEKAGRRVEIIMSTATAIINALTTSPFLAGLGLTTIAAATGAAQLAAVDAQQNPYASFAFGGWIPGRGSQDDRPFMGRGGEFVMPPIQASLNAESLEAMRAGRNVGGGDVHIHFNGPVIGSQAFVEQELMPRIKQALRNGHRFN